MGLRRQLCRCAAVVLSAGVLIAGCGASKDPPTPPSPLPLATFTVSGIVRSQSASQPLEGATITANGVGSDNQPRTVVVSAAADGRYTVDGLRAFVTVKATQDGFYPFVTALVLDANKGLDLVMEPVAPLAPEDTVLALGQTVYSTLGPTDDKCDRSWDANAPCRHFGFTAPESRTFEFSLRFPACPELELHVFDPQGQRIALGSNRNQFSLGAILRSGAAYQLRVMAYYSCEWFEVTVR